MVTPDGQNGIDRMKILVVDDDMVTGTLLKKSLTKQGYEVKHFTNGAKALEALQEETYRIILTDWMMPEMDGPSLCRHVREMNLTDYTYIILLTAKSSKDDAVAGLEAGADDYIVKPFDNQELLARIRAGQRLVELEDINRDTQQKLSHTEKLAAVGQLSAGIAHEINNPIGFINSNLNSLHAYVQDVIKVLACYREMTKLFDESITQKKLNAKLPKMLKESVKMEEDFDMDFMLEDMQELVTDCVGGAERIKTIVHEMRYFAHPEQQSIEPCDITKLLNEVVAQFSENLPSDVTIDNTVCDLPEIECNIPHIEQAFIKLVKNALDAVDGKGQIVIEGRVKGKGIEIEVKDNGSGIAPEHLTKVFDPFFTTRDVGQGVGLGLTTALNIVKMHNGSIKAESTPGEATSFTVYLPLPAERLTDADDTEQPENSDTDKQPEESDTAEPPVDSDDMEEPEKQDTDETPADSGDTELSEEQETEEAPDDSELPEEPDIGETPEDPGDAKHSEEPDKSE